MTGYRCPVCRQILPRDLKIFLDHAHGHIIDEIKKEHPEWVQSGGGCPLCAEYFEKAKQGLIRSARGRSRKSSLSRAPGRGEAGA